ncbi:MAG: hypothetical protein FJ335_10245, partial [Sphingomonadales bacterium]|nr:hypothetical protein [Sphingomonadales bacterium]
MARAQGINAVMAAAIETAYGQSPASGFKRLPFVSSALGEEQPLIEDDQLGFGREGLDPTYDAITNDGDLVVPVDTRAIGFWLRALFGPPATSGSTGAYTHVFTSGAASLPSVSVEIGNPEVPSFSMNYGLALNQLRIALSRTGMLNATLSMIGQGETDPTNSSAAGTLSALQGPRFAQATGSITMDGATLAEVVSADFAYSNAFEKVEVIRADGRIGGVDPGKVMTSGTLTTRFANRTLLDKARAKTPVALELGWVNGAASLKFA